ncbi:hypothetical protein GOP47_0006633 [Adiantum capillus-veneris]|uniref:Uncharacterized protein n=1 Tax=Adiantum capillus-veneris TaxID=13818 RepID=A0A9D4V412_ADICA|nr:hypothetical protein GOP47_0006628 [Adiantum capillus-veneris]KAI5078962.1 hypothetical protein GOP47_0006633 [Adiantum capillus-veneris]
MELVSVDVVPYSLEGVRPRGLRGLQDGIHVVGDPIEDLSATSRLELGVGLKSGFEFGLGHFLAHLFINSCKTQSSHTLDRGQDPDRWQDEGSSSMARRRIGIGWG